MLSISKHANLHFGTRNVGQLNRATKPLILLWVIIFQANLKLNGLGELAWLLIHTILYGCHSFSDGIPRKLTASKENIQNPPNKSVLGLKDQRTQIQEQKKKTGDLCNPYLMFQDFNKGSQDFFLYSFLSCKRNEGMNQRSES